MKEITILSGKGGTGKTSITSAIASIASDAVFCDNDVDAADLHLILNPTIKEEYTFSGGWTVSINETSCIDCGICSDHCRFDAIHINGHGKLEINPFKCEGCRLCERLCPVQAITSVKRYNNYWYVSDTRFGILVHAKMGPGEENSGKLVSEVRKKAKELAIASHARYLINDGPPGIGCAAISSLTGTDMVIMVIESTISGLHDARRLVELIDTFSIPTYALVNKYDINPSGTEETENFLEEESIPLLGKIPFDKRMVEAMVEGKTIVEFDDRLEISRIIEDAWKKLESL
ncbi:MAG: ATP-binding protein [Bacteroidales bacterium]|nr:ATP-binding protein [Bacteroidales bacterium]